MCVIDMLTYSVNRFGAFGQFILFDEFYEGLFVFGKIEKGLCQIFALLDQIFRQLGNFLHFGVKLYGIGQIFIALTSKV